MNYLERAEIDIYIAKLLLSPEGNPTNDEGIYDAAAYHVQQGVEKALKYVLHDVTEISDETREFRTHNLDDLIDIVESKTAYIIPDSVKEMAEEITSWEANSRYGSSIVTTRAQIEEAINLYENMKENIKQWEKDLSEEKEEPDIPDGEEPDDLDEINL